MLKAVRFDEDKHKHLLEYIDWFTDKSGRKNESEAIRFLMQAGYDSIMGNEPVKLPESEPLEEQNNFNVNELKDILRKEIMDEMASVYQNKQSDLPQEQPVNMDSLKKELMNEVMAQINDKTFSQLNTIIDKLSNMQPVIVQQPTNGEPVNETKPTVSKTPKKKIEIPADADGLLGNLLANANR